MEPLNPSASLSRHGTRARSRRIAVTCVLLAAAAVASPRSVLGQTNGVASVTPARNTVGVSAGTDITLEFSDPVRPSSIDSTTVRVYGRWSGPAAGEFRFENGDRLIRLSLNRPFFAGEQVSVSVSDSVTFDDGTPLSGGHYWSFWVRSLPADLTMTETDRVPIRLPGENRIQSYGAYAGDLNGDGWSDLAIPNEIAADVRVFLNQSGTFDAFRIYPLPGSSIPSANEGADFNGDGLIDLAVGNNASDNVNLLLGTRDGQLNVMPAIPASGDSRAVCVLDIDSDGDDDIITASRSRSSLHLLINDGAGTFRSPVPIDGGGDGETSCAVADANGDGHADLFVGSYFSSEVSLLLGDGRGSLFLSSTVPVPGRPWMLAAGDVDGDGYADVASAGSSDNTASVIRSDQRGQLQTPRTFTAGIFPLAIDLGDIDGDGDLDLVTSNYSSASFTVFENRGGGLFSRHRDYPASQAGSCAILHDRDNNGTLDMTAVDELDDLLILYDTTLLPVGTESDRGQDEGPSIEIHPNPGSGDIRLSVFPSNSSDVNVSILDMLGRVVDRPVVLSSAQHRHTAAWNSQSFAAGIYFAVFHLDSKTRAAKFIVTH